MHIVKTDRKRKLPDMKVTVKRKKQTDQRTDQTTDPTNASMPNMFEFIRYAILRRSQLRRLHEHGDDAFVEGFHHRLLDNGRVNRSIGTSENPIVISDD